MKDQEQITKSLIQLSKLRFKDNKTDYELGVGNMAENFLSLISSHANSFEYKNALIQITTMARNAKNNEKNSNE